VFVGTCGFGFLRGPRIDMWEMDDKSHTFGHWSDSGWIPEGPPEKTLVLPITENGNYPCNPDATDMAIFLAGCVGDPSHLTRGHYNATFCK